MFLVGMWNKFISLGIMLVEDRKCMGALLGLD